MHREEILDDILFTEKEDIKEFVLPYLRDGIYKNIVPLEDGRVLFFYSDICRIEPNEGFLAILNEEPAPNGRYKWKGTNKIIEIKRGRYYKLYRRFDYKLKNYGVLTIEVTEPYGVQKGNPVFLNGTKADDGLYKIGWLNKIEVIDGKVFDFFII